ncbi:MAG: prephenate dehydratase [Polyangiaceae bacterium]|nr:prephenate dehydratase [Polyangiaceae bacterium]
MGLQDLRLRIDAIDDRLLELLDERARVVADAFAEKRRTGLPLHDPRREQQVLARVERLQTERPEAVFPARAVRPVFREILSACLSVHADLEVAFLGPPGTHSHAAAQMVFGLAARYVSAATIPAVFDAVTRGSAEVGVVPIENSTEGGVGYTLDSLLESALMIRGELVLDITQSLVGQNEDLAVIERVYSHPQGLAQCRQWLARNLPTAQLVASTSTSNAAREAANDPAGAAIAARLAAEIHGLRVLREGIQDRMDNSTRFVVIGKEDAVPTGDDKTTIVFSTPHEQGALKRVLEVLHSEGLNMTRIESRPRPGAQRWQYVFFTDVVGHRSDPPVARALPRLQETCAFVKVLGSYPRAP